MAIALGPGSRIELDSKTLVFTHTTSSQKRIFRDEVTGEVFTLADTEIFDKWLDGKATLNVSADPLRSDPVLTADFTSFPEQDQIRARRRLKYVKAVMAVDTPGPQSVTWDAAIKAEPLEPDEKKRPSWLTVRPWVHVWKASNCDPRSLLPRYSRCGRRPVNRGEDEKGFLDVLISSWLTQERLSRVKFYRKVAEAYKLARTKIPLAVHWKEPTKSWLRRRLDKIDKREVLARRYGEKAAKDFFEHTGTTPVAHYPLQVVEIDHTRLNLNVVDPSRKILLGRPWITVAIDRYTRMIWGVYIGFEPPSAYSVGQCLMNGIKPKTWLNKLWPDFAGRWEACGIPVLVLVDNGAEFISENFQHMGAALDMTIRLAPVKMPEYKGVVERFMRTLEESCLSGLPGRTFSNTQEKGDYDAEKAATLTLEDFRKYFHFWLMADYAWKTHSEIMDVPAARWRKALEWWTPTLPKSIHDLNIHLARRDVGYLTAQGVVFEGIRYQSDTLEGWFRTYPDHHDVILKVDDSDLGKLYVVHPKFATPAPALAVENQRAYATGLSLFAHLQIKKAIAAKNHSLENCEEALATKQAHFLLYEKLIRMPNTRNRAKLARNVTSATLQPNYDLYESILEDLVEPNVMRKIDAEMLADRAMAAAAAEAPAPDVRPTASRDSSSPLMGDADDDPSSEDASEWDPNR